MRVLVIEDDDAVAQSLKLLLRHHSYGVDIASTGEQALDWLETFEYDLLILDLLLPDADGVNLCQRLRGQNYLVPILLLTGQDNAEQKAVALEAGADDYVVKPFNNRELLARVQALLRRGTLLSTPHLSWGPLRLNPNSRQVSYGGQVMGLTPKEYALLELMLRYGNQTFSAKLLLDRVWAAEDCPGEETVRTHIKGLRQKLRQAGAPLDLIETIHRVGYRLNPVFQEQGVALPQMTQVVVVAPASDHQTVRQALDGDRAFRFMPLAQYDQVLPHLSNPISGHNPTLVLLSYDLDPVASLALCRRLHQLKPWKHLPIMFMIGQKTADILQQVFDAGACDVVEQPIVGLELRTRMAHHIQRMAQAQSSSQLSPQRL